MAYVTPRGTIELYQNVPLTSDYTDTIYFSSESAKRSYFSEKLVGRYTNQMYTRVHGNKIRVNALADGSIFAANYLGFTNGRNNKWYYAFITAVEYVNEQVTEITYELDELMTWQVEARFLDCFIERQHSTTDVAGDNLQPEPINCDEHICCTIQREVLNSGSIGYILTLGTVTKGSNATGDLYSYSTFNGIASTVKYIYFSDGSSLITFLNKCEFANGFVKGLLNGNDFWCPLTLYAVPSAVFSVSGSTAHTSFGDVTMLPSTIMQSTFQVSLPTFHGFGISATTKYTPKNNKLFTYPYTYLVIETPTKSQEYKYETFTSANKKFKWYSVCNPEPALLIAPEGYNGVSNDFKYCMTIDDFPQLQIYSSGLWGAAGNNIGSTIKVGASMLAAAGAAAGASALGIANYSAPEAALIVGKRAIKNTPEIRLSPDIKSSGGATNLAPILAAKSAIAGIESPFFAITATQYGLRKEYAQTVDKFFSKYGYAQNKVGNPNRHARSRWTYIKTRDCAVSGPIPSEAQKTICRAMDNGITWWSPSWQVGLYTNPSTGELYDNP